MKVEFAHWQDSGHKIGGVKAYYDKEEKVYYTVVKGEKCDFEAWEKISGKKAKHRGAIECIEGSMYEGPHHPISPFE